MTYLIIWPDGHMHSNFVEKDTQEEAIETIRNLLDDGSVTLDSISVYKAESLKITLGIE